MDAQEKEKEEALARKESHGKDRWSVFGSHFQEAISPLRALSCAMLAAG